jgi:RNA methyltransferase, TrmH family
MPSEISSPHNPLIKETRALGLSRSEREARGLAVLEGVRLAEEALAAGTAIGWFLYTEELVGKERGAQLVQRLTGAGARGYRVTGAVLAKAATTEHSQGLVAVWSPHPRGWNEFGPGPLLVCDALQDPGNLGTMLRTAEAMGAGGAVLTGSTVDPLNPKVVRSAMGSLFRLPLVREEEPEQAAAALADRGYALLVAEAGGGSLPWELDLTGRVAIAVGSEAHGPSPGLRSAAAATVRIPMPGPVESLNAAVAAAVLLYEAVRQRKSMTG